MLRKSLILGALLLGFLAAGAEAQTTETFEGKITEISKTTQVGLGETGTFYIIKLDTRPQMGFRISREKALKYGLIEGGATAFLTPKQVKSLGWQVRLTVIKETKPFSTTSSYQVEALERLDR